MVYPHLDNGGIVISDRSVCSSLAIQGWTQGLGLDLVWKANEVALGGRLPDAVLFMDLDVNLGISRAFDESGDKREKKDHSFTHKIYEGYQKLFSFSPVSSIMKRVDASGSIDSVFTQILQSIDLPRNDS